MVFSAGEVLRLADFSVYNENSSQTYCWHSMVQSLCLPEVPASHNFYSHREGEGTCRTVAPLARREPRPPVTFTSVPN
jgi:hypothetical protein